MPSGVAARLAAGRNFTSAEPLAAAPSPEQLATPSAESQAATRFAPPSASARFALPPTPPFGNWRKAIVSFFVSDEQHEAR
jgi:hypothetical protein